jgi:hypothetical protein
MKIPDFNSFNSRFKGKVKKNIKSHQSEIDGMSESEPVTRVPRITKYSTSNSQQTEVNDIPNGTTTVL